MKTPLSLDDARRVVADFVAHYNHVRLHSAIGYVAPADKLAERETVIFAERDRKLNAARKGGELLVRLLEPRSNLDRTGHCLGRHAALGSEMAWAEDRATWATQPERRPRDQDRRGRHDAALSFPSGLVRKR